MEIENFGLVKVKIVCPYTNVLKYYVQSDYDIIGLYYPYIDGYETVLYDVYSGAKLDFTHSVGEMMSWEKSVEVSTTKFYGSIESDDVRNAIISMFIEDLEDDTFEKTNYPAEYKNCHVFSGLVDLMSQSNTKNLLSVFTDRISNLNIRTSNESIYKRKTNGLYSEVLDKFYSRAHNTFFDVLKWKSNRFESIKIPRTSFVADNRTNLENKMYRSLVKVLKKDKEKMLEITKSDCDLGNIPFVTNLIVRYFPENKGNVEILTNECNVIISKENADLTFLSIDQLKQILKYVMKLGNSEFSHIENEIISEILFRDLK